MKTTNRIALIYGASVLGAAGISYFVQKRRGQELLMDTLINGAIAGTALNVVGFLLVDGVKVPVYAPTRQTSALVPMEALTNGDEPEPMEDLGDVYEEADETVEAKTNSAKPSGDMGNMPKNAVELLAKLNTGRLYADLRGNGVKISAVPENPSIVSQEED